MAWPMVVLRKLPAILRTEHTSVNFLLLKEDINSPTPQYSVLICTTQQQLHIYHQSIPLHHLCQGLLTLECQYQTVMEQVKFHILIDSFGVGSICPVVL